MSKKKNFWKKQKTLFTVMLCFLLTFTSLGVSSLVGDVLLTADADDVITEDVSPEEEVEEPSEVEEEPQEEDTSEETEQEETPPQDVSTFDAKPRAATVEVSDWTTLKAAMSDSNVSHIKFTKHITRDGSTASANDLPEVNRNLIIDGNGFTLDFTTVTRNSFVLATASTPSQFTLSNIVIQRSGANYVVAAETGDANWNINFHNVSNGSSSDSRLVTARNSVINFTGTVNWLMPTSTYNEMIYTRYIYIKDGATVNLSTNTGAGLIRLNPVASTKAVTGLEVLGGSTLNINTGTEQAIFANNNSSSATQNRVQFKVEGNSHVNIESTGSSSGDDGGVVVICGSTIAGNEASGIYVNSGSSLTVNSKGAMPALIQQVTGGGEFNVDGAGSNLNLYSKDGHNTYGATIRFRYVGNQTFNVTNQANVKIVKEEGSRAPAIRFFGDGNAFKVSGGSQVLVQNAGDGTPRDGNSDARNQAIQYQSASSASFSVDGKNSAISIIAENGCALDMDASDATINATNGAIFIVEGNTAGADAAVINGRNLDFHAENILYYDFVNNRSGGGSVFRTTNGSTSKLESINSDVAVWKKGANVDGNPWKSWVLIDYSLTGQNFTTIANSSDPDFNSGAASFGSTGMAGYTRISGNNATPIIDELRNPENADKSIFGHARVPEGLDLNGRDAWTDEVYVKILEVKADGTQNTYYAKTIGKDNDNPGLAVYGEEPRGGMYTVPLNEFLTPGSTYEVLEAWRGDEDPTSSKRHVANAEDILVGKVTVSDVTPPLPVTVTNTLYTNGNKLEGTWELDAIHNNDKPVKLTVTLNGVEMGNEGTINDDNTWNYTFPAGTTLKENDVVQIFLTDANGNKNPVATKDYHDATFKAATKVIVQKVLYTISANDVIIGLDNAKLVVDDQDFINLAKAKAIDTSLGTETPVKVKSKGGYKAEAGEYKVVFSVGKEETITKEVTFEVLPYDVVEVNDEYIIGANHIEIRLGEAKKIEDNATYAATELKSLTGAKGWKRSDRSEVAVSLDTHTVKGVASLYKATFKVDADPSVKATVDVNVINGKAPVLTVNPEFMSLNIGDAYDYKHGVSAYDEEDKDITSKVISTGTVDTSKKGMYVVEYSVTDSDYNTVKKSRVVAVGLYVGKDYAYDLHNYVILKDDVTGTDAEILEKTEAKAWSIATGLPIPSADLMVKDNGGYKAEVKDYEVVIKVKAATDPKDEVKAIAKVVDGDVIKEGDKYTLVASNIVMTVDEAKAMTDNSELVKKAKAEAWKLEDLSKGTVKLETTNFTAAKGDYTATFYVDEEKATKVTVKIKVIDKDVIEHGDKYTIGANNLVMTLDEAKAISDNTKLIELSKAEAFKRKDMSAGTVKLETTNFKAAEGDYTATFYVDEEKATKVTIKIKVKDGNVIEHGDKYTLVANNLVMTLDEAKAISDNTKLIELSKAEAFKRKDMSAGTVKLETTNFTAAKGDYTAIFYVDEEKATKATIKIKVIDKHVIETGSKYTIGANNLVMNVEQAKAITDNTKLIELSKAVAINRDDMSAGTVKLETTDFKAAEGTYTATFYVDEEKDTKATITIKVMKKDELTSEDHYAIGANNITITRSQAENYTNDNLINWGNAEGWKVKDFSTVAVEVKEANIGTDTTSTDYYVVYQVKEHPSTTVKVKVTVINGNAPVLTVNPEFMSLNIGDAYDYKHGVSAYDEEDKDITSKVISTGTVDTSKKGMYVVEYSVTDSDYNTVKKSRVVAVGLYVGKDYAYDLHNYVILKDDVTGTDAEILEKTEVEAWSTKTGLKLAQSEIMVKDNGGYKAEVKDYEVVIKAKAATDPKDEVKAIAKVVDGDVIKEGDKYTLVASNIVMTVDEAKAMTDNNELVKKAKAEAWKLEDLSKGTVKLETTNFTAAKGDYTATFYVDEEKATKVTVKIKVIDKDVIEHGDKYTIGANNLVMTLDEAKAVSDNTKLIELSKAEAFKRKDMSAGTVKLEATNFTAAKGDYTATFYVDEEKATKATIKIKVIDKDVIEHGDEYTIGANNLVMTLDEAKAISDNTKLIELSKAEAFKRKDMSAGTVKLETTNFTAAKGDYTATFYVDEEKATKVTVKIKVIDKDVIEHGDKYTIGANNIEITRSVAESITNDQLIDLTKAEAFKRKDMSAGTVKVKTHNVEGTVGTYYVTFYVAEEPATEVRVAVKVVNGNAPVLTVNPEFMSLNIGDVYDYKHGVSAYDEEDKDITSKVISTGTVDTSKKGMYVVEYSVTDSDYNTVKKSRVVAVGLYVGKDYAYDLHNYVILKDDVTGTDAEILEKTEAKAWSIATGLPIPSADLMVKDNGGYKAEVKDYEVVIKVKAATDPKDEVKAIAKVVDGDVIKEGDKYTLVASNIVMTVDEAKAMTDNSELVKKAKAEAWKLEDLSKGTVKLETTNFTAAKGDYTATFYVDEEKATKVTVKIKVIDKDVIEHGDKYTIGANNLVMILDEAKAISDNTKLIELSKAEAFKRKDMSAGTVKLETTNFKAAEGDYTATFYVDEEKATKVTIKIKVKDGNVIEHGDKYTLVANNLVMTLDEAKAISDNTKLIELSKAEAFKRKDMSAGTVKLETTNFTAAKGDYTATFYVDEEKATKATIKIKVIDKHVIETGSKYTIGANNLVMNVEQAKAITDNTKLIELSKAVAINRDDMSAGTVKLETTDFKAAEGTYTATFYVDEEKATKATITIKVMKKDELTSEEHYAIGANNITITRSQAENYTNNNLIDWGNAEGWKVKDFSTVAVEVKEANIGTDTTSTSYYAIFQVKENPSTTVKVKVTVINGNAPVLTVNPEFMSLNIGDAYDYKYGVSAYDEEDKDITSKVISTGTVDTSKKGMYVVEYSVTDSDYNIVKKSRVVAVGLYVGKDYAYDLHNYVILKDDVTGTDAEILEKTEVEAWSTKTGLKLAQSEIMVKDNGGYKAEVKDYEVVIKAKAATDPKDEVKAIAKVVDGDVIKEGDKYTLVASNIVMTVDEAKAMTDNSELVGKAKAEAWKLEDLSKGTVKLETTNFAAAKGDYTATFYVDEEKATKATIKIKVIDKDVIEHGDKYTIGANNLVMTLDEAKAISDNTKLIELSKAEAFKRKDMSAGTVKLETTNFTAAKGDYTATFYVDEEKATKATIKIKVIDKDVIEHGDKYTIGANNIEITRSVAESITNDQLIDLTKAEAFKRKDMSVGTVKVKTHNVEGTVGTYYVTFYVAEEPATEVRVSVKVVNGNAPVLTVNPEFMSLNIGDTYDYKHGVSAYDEEDKDITSKVISTGTVDTSKKGMYVVEYSVTDSDYNTVKKSRVVAVGLYVGKDYAYDLHNYVILKDDVTGTDAEILEKTEAKAWSIATGLPVPSADLMVKDNGGYKAEVKDYEVVIKVKAATDPKDEVKAIAKVVDGDVIKEGDKYTLVASNIVMTVDEAKAVSDNTKLIELSKAEAWKLEDLSKGTVKLETTNFTAAKGDYTATFYVDEEKATKVTVKIKVIDKDVIEHGDKYTIGANNLVMTLDEAKAVSDNTKLIELSKAEAFKRKDMSAGTVKLETTNFKAAEGDYTATFYVDEEKATKVTIKIKVKDGNVIEHGDEYTIVANNLVMTLDEAKAVSDNTKLIELSKAEAFKRKDMSVGTVKLETTNFKAANGDYTATFYVDEEKATKAAIKIKVIDKDVIEHGDKYTIGANNLVMTVDEAKAITDNTKLIELSKAVAINRDDMSAGTVKLETTNFTAAKGDYTATFYVDEEKDTKATIKIKVIDKDVIEHGDKYTIGANNIEITRSVAESITNDQLIDLTKAEAFKRKDMSAGTVKVKTHNVEGTVGTYYVTFYVAEEPATEVRVAVKVVNGNAPVLTVNPEFMSLNIGDAYDYKHGVSAYDEEDKDITSKVISTGTVDTSKKGMYVVEYSVTDSDYNTVKKSRVVAVGLYVGKDYAYDLHNYVILKDDVTGTDAEILEKTEAKAWSIATGLPVPSADLMVKDNGGYKAEVKDYEVVIKVKAATDPKDEVKAIAKVVDGDVIKEGDKYTLVASNIVMTVDEAKAMTDNSELVKKAKAEAWKLEDLSKGTVKLETTNFTAAKGDYTATFYVDEEKATKVTVKIKVIDKDVIEHGDKYTIGANNLVMTLDEAKAISDNTKLIELSKAEAFKRKDMSAGTVKLETTDFTAAKGDYTATFYVDEEKATKVTIKIKVKDGNVIEHGDKYTLVANNLVMTLDEAKAISDNTKLIELSKAEAFKRKDMSVGTVKLETTNFTAAKGNYTATFYVDEEKDTKATIKIKVIDKDVIEHGDKYTIGANNLVMTLDEAKAITDNTKLIELSKAVAINRDDMSAGTVKLETTNFTAAKGDYTATFYVDEEKATKATIKIKVIDKDVIEHGDEYTIGANNLVMTLDEAKAISDNTKLIELSKAEAFKRKDMSAGTVKLETTNFKAAKGDYTATFYVDEEKATKATIKIKVIDKDVIEHGDEYTIGANNLVMTLEEAEAIKNNNELIKLSKAEAFKRKDMSAGTVKLETTNFKAAEGDYTATFYVDEEKDTKATIKIKVKDGNVIEHGDEYTIVANNLVMTLAEAEAISDNTKLIELSKAEAFKRKDMSAGTVKLETTDFKAAEGDYTATFYVDEEKDTKATIKIKVKAKDVIVKGDKYYIGANHITINSHTAETITNDQLIALTEAEAWLKKDLSSAKVEVESHNVIGEAGVYQVTFHVVKEPTTKVTVNVNVTKTALDITAKDFTISHAEASNMNEAKVLELSEADVIINSKTRALAPTKESIAVHQEHLRVVKGSTILGGVYDVKLSVEHEGVEYATVIKVTVTPGRKPSVTPPTVSKPSTAVTTGDDTNLNSLFAMGIISFMSVIYLVKRKKEEEE
ncbi:immunoglobulin-like domain-containing protein [Breznakia sp. PFB2-8]|uniref:immunoglobulin-like domain-containing protein n=1 Tax=unclassified Breznakia TaxID=2623764 RepID=UPI0029E59A66|nr:uncharacterized protein YfaQ (DUF2300 family) [Breznakia sp. PFB2-8]MDF9859720.1 uncharacterized protein YfaQ (DUF2300 family) [Breznakia sp. PH5-24]